MKTKSNRSRLLIIILSVMVLILGGVIAYAATFPGNTITKPTGSTNPDDATNYLQVSTNSQGLTTVKFQIADASASGLSIGTIRVIGDYMYVYGYYYNRTAAPSQTSLTGWTAQPTGTDMGWGCAAISKTKTSYADPAGAIEGIPVTYMNYAYYGCTSMQAAGQADEYRLPRIPSTVKHTDYMFGNCTGLVRASLTTASTLTANTFNGCTNLIRLFIGQNLKTASSGAIGNVHANCAIFLDGANTYTAGWNSGKTVNTNQDILLWALD